MRDNVPVVRICSYSDIHSLGLEATSDRASELGFSSAKNYFDCSRISVLHTVINVGLIRERNERNIAGIIKNPLFWPFLHFVPAIFLLFPAHSLRTSIMTSL